MTSNIRKTMTSLMSDTIKNTAKATETEKRILALSSQRTEQISI